MTRREPPGPPSEARVPPADLELQHVRPLQVDIPTYPPLSRLQSPGRTERGVGGGEGDAHRGGEWEVDEVVEADGAPVVVSPEDEVKRDIHEVLEDVPALSPALR